MAALVPLIALLRTFPPRKVNARRAGIRAVIADRYGPVAAHLQAVNEAIDGTSQSLAGMLPFAVCTFGTSAMVSLLTQILLDQGPISQKVACPPLPRT